MVAAVPRAMGLSFADRDLPAAALVVEQEQHRLQLILDQDLEPFLLGVYLQVVSL